MADVPARIHSLFLREDGMLIGYVEVLDRRRPDQGASNLLGAFRLEDQLASIGEHR